MEEGSFRKTREEMKRQSGERAGRYKKDKEEGIPAVVLAVRSSAF